MEWVFLILYKIFKRIPNKKPRKSRGFLFEVARTSSDHHLLPHFKVIVEQHHPVSVNSACTIKEILLYIQRPYPVKHSCFTCCSCQYWHPLQSGSINSKKQNAICSINSLWRDSFFMKGQLS